MAGPPGGLGLVDPQANHHVEMFRHQRLDHFRGACGIIGGIAIDQHVNVGIDIGKHATDHMALALAALAAYRGAGFPRHFSGPIRRVVVIDKNFSRRQHFTKIGNHIGNRGFLIEARHQNCNPRLRGLGYREFGLRKIRQRRCHAGQIAVKPQWAFGFRYGAHRINP